MATSDNDKGMQTARRQFLASCGKFAIVTPPTVTLLLANAGRNYAAALSGPPPGGPGGNGMGVQARLNSRSIFSGGTSNSPGRY